ncbi:aminotransferase class V-fold PLP-dependent enzyme [Clostridium sp. DSM 100503]|uniref:aminotransferase class V-fold PLP-dependent enzyme n=1 Tax=Clostridium sp. DSM 100503 TaxID=2963282 RepID=UPI002149DA3B|nr:aminotransferase class V-fold PLP-dependent enzyme [Clostridium sp. DSM 100503]MCR1951535.1 aminotransferase class V-fold PLP-dependent enzyme [Clostridium sp. DSM 100503]
MIIRNKKEFLKCIKWIVGIENPIYFSGDLNKYIYAGWAASGRIYKGIEEKMFKLYASYYSNIYTKDNIIGNFMNNEYEKSKEIIKDHFGAKNNYFLFLNGTGKNGAIDRLQRILFEYIDIDEAVIFITSMEYNSNYLLWLELGVKVEIIEPDNDGNLDLNSLKELLIKNNDKKYKIGSFTACSKLT